MADMSKSIRLAVDTGKVRFGSRNAVKTALNGEAKLIVVAQNCPKMAKADITHYSKLSGIGLYYYDGTSLELGSLCGKPFPVSALSIVDAGNSDILNAARGVAPAPVVEENGQAEQ